MLMCLCLDEGDDDDDDDESSTSDNVVLTTFVRLVEMKRVTDVFSPCSVRVRDSRAFNTFRGK